MRIWPEALLQEPRFIPAGCFPLPLAPLPASSPGTGTLAG